MDISFGQIEKVAHEARADFEAGLVPQDLLIQLYGDYCADIDTGLFVKEALQIFPRGNCGLASVYLRHKLRAGEVTYGSYGNEGHTIWHLGEMIMADITCDQFGGKTPKVHVGPIMRPWSLQAPDQRPYDTVTA